MFVFNGIQKQFIIAGCIYIGQILVGCGLSWTAPVIPKLVDPEQSPLPYTLSETQISLIGSIVFIGGLPGPYIVGYFSNVKGRKPCMIFGGIVNCCAFITLAAASDYETIIIGRLLCGFGNGIIAVCSLVYLGEVISTHIRGALLTGLGLFLTTGSLVMVSHGPWVSFQATTYLPILLSLIYTTGMFFVPESPIYHLIKGKEKDVKNILERLDRMEDIEEIISKQKAFQSSFQDWRELFTTKGNRRALGIAVFLNIAQQCSGVLAVAFFATSIFEMASSSIEPNIATLIMTCTQLVGSVTAPLFVERSGRKCLILISTVLCCLSMTVLGIPFYLEEVENEGIERIRWLPLLALIVFFIGYDMGLGVIPGTLIGEMFECNNRSQGSAIAVTSGWLAGFAVTTAFTPIMVYVGGYVAFWTFAAVCACAFFFTVFFVPETKGKSLVQIQEMLAK